MDFLCGATTVPPTLVARCEKIGLHTYRSYGSSEHPTVQLGRPIDPLEKRLNTDGGLTAGNEVRIIDDDGRDLPLGAEGEIITRGPELFLGYLDPKLNDDAFLPGGWFRTGDVGRMDAEVLPSPTAKKDVIIRGGENISSLEVEDLMLKHPQVADVAAVAKLDERLAKSGVRFRGAALGRQPRHRLGAGAFRATGRGPAEDARAHRDRAGTAAHAQRQGDQTRTAHPAEAARLRAAASPAMRRARPAPRATMRASNRSGKAP